MLIDIISEKDFFHLLILKVAFDECSGIHMNYTYDDKWNHVVVFIEWYILLIK